MHLRVLVPSGLWINRYHYNQCSNKHQKTIYEERVLKFRIIALNTTKQDGWKANCSERMLAGAKAHILPRTDLRCLQVVRPLHISSSSDRLFTCSQPYSHCAVSHPYVDDVDCDVDASQRQSHFVVGQSNRRKDANSLICKVALKGCNKSLFAWKRPELTRFDKTHFAHTSDAEPSAQMFSNLQRCPIGSAKIITVVKK